MEKICVFGGIAVEPPKNAGVKTRIAGGMQIIDVKAGLEPLKVVFRGDMKTAGDRTVILDPGEIVYVPQDALNRCPWAKEIFTIAGKSFIVVPTSNIVAHETRT